MQGRSQGAAVRRRRLHDCHYPAATRWTQDSWAQDFWTQDSCCFSQTAAHAFSHRQCSSSELHPGLLLWLAKNSAKKTPDGTSCVARSKQEHLAFEHDVMERLAARAVSHALTASKKRRVTTPTNNLDDPPLLFSPGTPSPGYVVCI